MTTSLMGHTCLIADDHLLVRAAISRMLKSHGMTVVHESSNGQDAFENVLRLTPDVALLDACMQPMGGIEAVGRLRKLCDTRLVIFSGDDETRTLALERGAHGYVYKSEPAERLISTLECLLVGKPAASGNVNLTERETEVLALVSRGFSSLQIATVLDIGIRTVETHRANLMRKLGAECAAELVAIAVRRNLV